MRKTSSNFEDAMLSKNPKVFLLGKLDLPDEPLFLSSLNYTVTFNGDTYLKGSKVLSFGPPRVSSSVDRQIYELIVADSNDELQEKIRAGIVGVSLSVYIGFYDQATGQPMLNPEDVVLAYEGAIDSGAIAVDDNSKLCKLQAASPMGKLDALGAYMVSRDGMDQVNTDDTSFDEVIAGSKEVNFKWGKKDSRR